MFNYKEKLSKLIKGESGKYRNSFKIIFLGNFFNLFFKFIISVILARCLGPYNFGILTLVRTIVSLFEGFASMKSNEVVARFVIHFLNEKNKSYAYGTIILGYLSDIILGTLCFIALYILSPFISYHIFKIPQMVELIRIYSIYTLFTFVIYTSVGLWQVFEKFKLMSFFYSISSLIKFFIIIFILRKNIYLVVWGYAISGFLIGVVGIILSLIVIKEKFINVKVAFPLKKLKEIFDFCLKNYFSLTLKSIYSYLDVLLLGAFTSPLQAGYYKIAIIYSGILGIFAFPFDITFFPLLTNYWEKKQIKDFFETLKKVTWYLFLISVFSGFFLVVFTKMFIMFTKSSQYLFVMIIIFVLIFNNIVNNSFIWIRSVILIIKKLNISIGGTFLAIVMLLISGYILVLNYGGFGMALAVLITSLISKLFFIYSINLNIKKECKL